MTTTTEYTVHTDTAGQATLLNAIAAASEEARRALRALITEAQETLVTIEAGYGVSTIGIGRTAVKVDQVIARRAALCEMANPLKCCSGQVTLAVLDGKHWFTEGAAVRPR